MSINFDCLKCLTNPNFVIKFQNPLMPTDVAQILYVKKLTKIQYDLINFGRKIIHILKQEFFFFLI